MRRARAVYDNDQALFCKVLDALCLGKVGEFQTFGALRDDAGAVATVIGTDAALNLVVSVGGALCAMLDGDGQNAMLENERFMGFVADSEAAMSTITGSQALLELVSSSGAAMSVIASSRRAMERICASEDAMGEMAASAVALNRIAKTDAARTAWMSSAFSDAHYDAIYTTLHGADESLFSKIETYYDTNYQMKLNGLNIFGILRENGTINDGSGVTESAAVSIHQEPIIALIKQADVTGSGDVERSLFLPQTKTRIYSPSFTKRVCMGGFAVTGSVKSGSSYSSAIKYAAYIPL